MEETNYGLRKSYCIVKSTKRSDVTQIMDIHPIIVRIARVIASDPAFNVGSISGAKKGEWLFGRSAFP